jgi:phosphatidylglycerophosphate synthase
MVSKKEKILNIPNLITSFRVPLTVIAAYFLLVSGSRGFAALFLAIAGITDFLDGQAARRLDQVTKFGTKFDMISDRIFIIIFAGALLVFSIDSPGILFLLMLCLSRELISLPAIFHRRIKSIPYLSEAKPIGKIQTTIQAMALVALTWGVSWDMYLIVPSFFVGIVAGAEYWRDGLSAIPKKNL